MKIGFNSKVIKNFVINSIAQMGNMFSDALNTLQDTISNHDNSLSSHEERITTLENSGGASGSSNLEFSQHIFEIFGTNGSEIREITVNRLYNNVFVNFKYDGTFENINQGMIGYNYIKLGNFLLRDNEVVNLFKCYGSIPVMYQVGLFDSYAKKGLLKINYENDKNMLYLVIDKDDIETFTNVADLSTVIIIQGSGVLLSEPNL